MFQRFSHLRWCDLLVWGFVFSLVLGACSPSAVVPDATATPIPDSPVGAGLTEESGAETPTDAPGFLNPTPTINFESPNPVQTSELQFVQQESKLVILAKFQNSLKDTILKDVQFEVLAFDGMGNRIAQETGTIIFLFPQQVTGLVRTFDLINGSIAKSVEVRFSGGSADEELKFKQPLKISEPASFIDKDSAILTGWLENKDRLTFTEVAINAIAYNSNGEIVGGGNGNAEFVPAKDKIGVSVPAVLTETPARVELYPWISAYSASLEGGSWWRNIRIRDWNFIRTSNNEIGGGAVLKNITDRILTGTYYIITASDDEGRVCWVDKGFIHSFLPEETLYFSPGILTAPATSAPTDVDMIIVPGEFGEYDLAYNPLVISNAVLLGYSELSGATPKSETLSDVAELPTQTETLPATEPAPANATNNASGDNYPLTTVIPDNPVSPTETPTIASTATEVVIPTEDIEPTAIAIQPGQEHQVAQVTVVNNLSANISSVLVTVLVMDKRGTIIGGGQAYSTMVPANGFVLVNVPVVIVGELEELNIKSSATLPPWAVIGQ